MGVEGGTHHVKTGGSRDEEQVRGQTRLQNKRGNLRLIFTLIS